MLQEQSQGLWGHLAIGGFQMMGRWALPEIKVPNRTSTVSWIWKIFLDRLNVLRHGTDRIFTLCWISPSSSTAVPIPCSFGHICKQQCLGCYINTGWMCMADRDYDWKEVGNVYVSVAIIDCSRIWGGPSWLMSSVNAWICSKRQYLLGSNPRTTVVP